MKKNTLFKFIGILVSLLVVTLCMIPASFAKNVPKMSKEELQNIMSDSDVVIIDVRLGKDWKSSEFKIKGAVRETPDELDVWLDKYSKDKKIVLYCA